MNSTSWKVFSITSSTLLVLNRCYRYPSLENLLTNNMKSLVSSFIISCQKESMTGFKCWFQRCVQSRPLIDACWGSLPVAEGECGGWLCFVWGKLSQQGRMQWLGCGSLGREWWGQLEWGASIGALLPSPECSWYLCWPYPLATSSEIT